MRHERNTEREEKSEKKREQVWILLAGKLQSLSKSDFHNLFFSHLLSFFCARERREWNSLERRWWKTRASCSLACCKYAKKNGQRRGGQRTFFKRREKRMAYWVKSNLKVIFHLNFSKQGRERVKKHCSKHSESSDMKSRLKFLMTRRCCAAHKQIEEANAKQQSNNKFMTDYEFFVSWNIWRMAEGEELHRNEISLSLSPHSNDVSKQWQQRSFSLWRVFFLILDEWKISHRCWLTNIHLVEQKRRDECWQWDDEWTMGVNYRERDETSAENCSRITLQKSKIENERTESSRVQWARFSLLSWLKIETLPIHNSSALEKASLVCEEEMIFHEKKSHQFN